MRGTLLFALALVLALLSAGAQAKSIQDEISAYLNPNEVASYSTVEVSGQRYVVVDVNGKPELAFNVQAELVTNETELRHVLDAYALQAGEGALTVDAAASFSALFNDTYASYQRCNKTFYDFVESNYVWSSFRCLEPAVGKACDSAFALRKDLDAGMRKLKPEMDNLPGYVGEGQVANAAQGMTDIVKYANASYANATAFDGFYKYFFGARMADDKDCGFDPQRLKEVVDRVGASVGLKITDVSANATGLAAEALRRKDNSDVRRLQVRGETALADTRKKLADIQSRYGQYNFPTDAFSAQLQKMERMLKDLEAANDTKSAEAQLNALFTGVADFNGLDAKYSLLIPSYAQIQSNVKDAQDAIAKEKLKYDYDQGKIASLEEDVKAFQQEIDTANAELKLGANVDAAKIDDLNAKSSVLKARASGSALSSAPTVPDWIWLVAAFVLALGGALFYLFRVRRRP